MPRPTVLTRRISGALALLLLPSVATAHTSLKRSDPANRSRLSVAPTHIGLWFTARPQLPFSKLRLVGPRGEIPLSPLSADSGNALRAEIRAPLAAGEYTVQWQTASADGHTLRGAFTFIVEGGGANPVRSSASARGDTVAASSDTPGGSEYHTARWFEFAALLAVLGALGFRHGVLPPLAARNVPTADAADRARRWGQRGVAFYVIAAALRLYTESAAVHGSGDALDVAELTTMLLGTSWGMGWLTGVSGAGVLLLGWTISKQSVTFGTPLALLGALGMTFSPALSGHAIAGPQPVLSVMVDGLHVAVAGIWVGGLFMVLVAGLPAMRRVEGDTDAAVAALVNSFHPIALFCAPLVVLAGIATSWIRLGGLSALWGTAYGRTLCVKILLVALVVSMGMYNSLRARRRLGAAEGTRHFRLTAFTELMFAALVLSVTTLLVTTPPPSEIATP